jgi:hypothetical protein
MSTDAYWRIVEIAAGIGLPTVILVLWLLYRLTHPCLSSQDLNAWIEVQAESWKPLERLLDPTEFEFLRRLGPGRRRVRKLRARRRTLFRIYIRRLVAEFNSTTQCLRDAQARRGDKRTDLAQTVTRQRWQFYRTLANIEMLLILDAQGWSDSGPSLELLHKLESLHLECRALVPASAESA